MLQDKVLNSTFLPTDKLVIYALINYCYDVRRQHLSTGILEELCDEEKTLEMSPFVLVFRT